MPWQRQCRLGIALASPRFLNALFLVKAKKDHESNRKNLAMTIFSTEDHKKVPALKVASEALDDIEEFAHEMLIVNKESATNTTDQDQLNCDVHTAADGTFQGPGVFMYSVDKVVWGLVLVNAPY